MHVAVLAFPFGSHDQPLHVLAGGLAAAAPQVTFSFLTSARAAAALSAAAAPPPNLNFYDVGLANSDEVDKDLAAFLLAAPESYAKAMAEAVRCTGGAPVGFLISDCFNWFAADLAGEGAPWVAVWPGGPHSFSAHIATDSLRRTEPDPDEDLGFIPGMAGTRVRDLPSGILSGDRDFPIARILHGMVPALPRAAAVAMNAFEGLDVDLLDSLRAKYAKFLPLGALNFLLPRPVKEDESGCLSWLDARAAGSVAYVAFGTVAALGETELGALAQGLEESGTPFVWALKRRYWGALPEGFLSRTAEKGLVVEWSPQAEVLKHEAVDAFVSHCGWNSVLEGLSAGVPMICRPFFGDQMLNARCISHLWKTGVGFPEGTITREGIAAALDLVLRTEEGRKMKKRAVEMKAVAARQVRAGGRSADNFQALVKMVSGM
ncbi:flavonol 3-O-glucosyltransferase-like [Wolffia australiana]